MLSKFLQIIIENYSSLKKNDKTSSSTYIAKLAAARKFLVNDNNEQALSIVRSLIQNGTPQERVILFFLEDIEFRKLFLQNSLQETSAISDELSQLARIYSKELCIAGCSEGKPGANSVSTEIINELPLGLGFANTSVNTVIFRSEGILTIDDVQIAAFYLNRNTLRIIKRDLVNDTIENFDLDGEYNLSDAHNSISIGYDRSKRIHLSYDHHSSKLRYRRSLKPKSIDNWTSEIPMTLSNEIKVTYPSFILPKGNAPLMMLYRDGSWKSGTAFLKWYDEHLQKWVDCPNVILSGSANSPWTSNAYWNKPVRGKNGDLHLSYCWRTDYFEDSQYVNNVNIGYAVSYDDGFSWLTSNGKKYKLPITQVNSETIYALPPCSNLINQTNMALDSLGRPHIVTYANDEEQIPQYKHIFFDGKAWKSQNISSRTRKFNLEGGGTLPIPISRPDLVIDDDDNIFVVHSSEGHARELMLTALFAPNYEYSSLSTQVLYSYSIGYAEPILDKCRWHNEKILSLLVQKNEQPIGDLEREKHEMNEPLTIVDIKIKKIKY